MLCLSVVQHQKGGKSVSLSLGWFQKQESHWIKKHGTPEEQSKRRKEIKDQERMPGTAKIVTHRPNYDRIRGNIGNLLHKPWTIEDHMHSLLNQYPYE